MAPDANARGYQCPFLSDDITAGTGISAADFPLDFDEGMCRYCPFNQAG